VQEQYPLSDGSAIRLTVARYYTPLGRSIQRSYQNGKEVYMDELFERYSSGQMLSPDSNRFIQGQTYITKKGKKVYGGGGIMPDLFVPIDTSRLQTNVTKLYLDGTFNNFVYQYYSQRLPFFAQYTSPADFVRRFDNINDAWKELVQFAKKDSINLDNIPVADRFAIEQRLKAYLARFRWRNQGFYEVLNANDPTIQKAINILSK
jgi:carboxyl-terminal processing protease